MPLNKGKTVYIASIFLLIHIQLLAQSKTVDLNNYFVALYKNQQFNGNILVAENGKIIYEASFGYADFAGKVLNTPNTLFPIASLSKTITATAMAFLSQALMP